MDFGLSAEQRLLDESLQRCLEANLPMRRVREILRGEDASKRDLWRSLVEVGVPGLLVPVDQGGAGLGVLDAVVAGGALARAAAPVPFLGTAVMAVVALREAEQSTLREDLLRRVASGQAHIGVAANELVSSREGAGVELRDAALFGRCLFVVDGSGADVFLVAIGEEGIAVVERDAHGLTVGTLSTVDATRDIVELILDGVRPTAWLRGSGGGCLVGRVLDAGRLVLAADILGCCDRALAMSVAYAKERRQFGRVIGSFQAVKHLCAEMAAELEPARALLWYAAYAFDCGLSDASVMAALAKSHLAEVGTVLLKTATEVHGGIGFTDEYDLHFFFKRVALDRQLLGSPDQMRERAARLQGWAATS
jgi:alkylation response protein AidB-like acyl-CoA dehydrogenase